MPPESADGAGAAASQESSSKATDLGTDLARMQEAASLLERAGQPDLARVALRWEGLDRATRVTILDLAMGLIQPPEEEEGT